MPRKNRTSGSVPFSIRLTEDEHAALKKAAAGLSMADYARAQLFGSNRKTRKTRGKFPVKDHEALGRVLGRLGSIELGRSFMNLTEAAKTGCLEIDPDVEDEIRHACGLVRSIRDDLMTALGVRVKNSDRLAHFNRVGQQ